MAHQRKAVSVGKPFPINALLRSIRRLVLHIIITPDMLRYIAVSALPFSLTLITASMPVRYQFCRILFRRSLRRCDQEGIAAKAASASARRENVSDSGLKAPGIATATTYLAVIFCSGVSWFLSTHNMRAYRTAVNNKVDNVVGFSYEEGMKKSAGAMPTKRVFVLGLRVDAALKAAIEAAAAADQRSVSQWLAMAACAALKAAR